MENSKRIASQALASLVIGVLFSACGYAADGGPAPGETLSQSYRESQRNNVEYQMVEAFQAFDNLYYVGPGFVSVWLLETSDGLVLLDKKPTKGSLPCYISTTANGQLLFIANYMGGNCITLELKKGGLMEFSDEIVHEGSGKDPDRQEASHPHSIVPDPLSKFVYVADLGLDKIMIYEIDYKEGKLNPAKTKIH